MKEEVKEFFREAIDPKIFEELFLFAKDELLSSIEGWCIVLGSIAGGILTIIIVIACAPHH
jgi:hypothetical protein